MPTDHDRSARTLLEISAQVRGQETGLHLSVGNRRQRAFRYALAVLGYDETQQQLAAPMLEAFAQVEAAVMTDEFDPDEIQPGMRTVWEPLHIPRPRSLPKKERKDGDS